MLQDALTALASDADAQLRYLKDQGVPGCIDELALDYDDMAAAANDMLQVGEIDIDQRDCIKSLNEFLKHFSGESNAHLWTPDALQSAAEWKQVRSMARNCLELLQLELKIRGEPKLTSGNDT